MKRLAATPAAVSVAWLLAGAAWSGSLTAAPTPGDPGRQDFIAWARAAAQPLATVHLTSDVSDLAHLCALTRGARVVALGEPAHGAEQPLALRNRLFAYLIERCGFTSVALETSFTESQAVQDYVAGGAGEAAQVARQNLAWGFGEYAENARLLEWLREHNHHTTGRKVRFYGIDLSGADNTATFTRPEVAIDAAVAYLRKSAPGISDDLLSSLKPLLDALQAHHFGQLARGDDVSLAAGIDSLDIFMRAHRAQLIAQSSRRDYDWALRNVLVAARLRDWLKLSDPLNDQGMRPDDYREVNLRDAAMADNALWALSQEGPKGRLLVFAHDAHVMDARCRGGIWKVFKEPPSMMGMHLRERLGSKLLIIGTLEATTEGELPRGASEPNGLEGALSNLGQPLFLLDVRTATHDPRAWQWLGQDRAIRANFESEIELVPREAFDIFVFVDRVGPAERSAR